MHKKYKLLHRRYSNQLKDFQHKLSNKLINNTKANTIIIGKLPTKAIGQNKNTSRILHKSLQNTGTISRFVRFLTYKATLTGKRVIEINE